MSVKLFILGRPGSGKSTAFRHIIKHLEMHHQTWTAIRFNDYEILQNMFRHETLFEKDSKKRKFQATEHGGFDVLNFSVLDTALKELEKQVCHWYCSSKEELMVIEFARDDYSKALEQFSPTFLKEAYFLVVDADVETCIQRVKDRVTNPPTRDNHYVSEDILLRYYCKQSIPSNSKAAQGTSIDKKRVKTISSQGSQQAFGKKVDRFIDKIINNESQDGADWWNLLKQLAQASELNAKHKMYALLPGKRVTAKVR